jgi:hypothetical protein
VITVSELPAEARLLAGRAGDYIEKHGWAQATFEAPTGAVCMTGAINRSGSFFRDEFALKSHLVDVLDVHPMGWNDEPGRTQSDVVGVLYAVEEGWL